jgi:hypothetical protein
VGVSYDARLVPALDALTRECREAPRGMDIAGECVSIARMLIEKNKAYGDSALSPLRVFSRASAQEQILVRIDDKLSRLSRGAAAGEDVVLDLIGYLVLLRIAQREST